MRMHALVAMLDELMERAAHHEGRLLLTTRACSDDAGQPAAAWSQRAVAYAHQESPCELISGAGHGARLVVHVLCRGAGLR